jgi:tetratricopeptide (TPR) repeat protein
MTHRPEVTAVRPRSAFRPTRGGLAPLVACTVVLAACTGPAPRAGAPRPSPPSAQALPQVQSHADAGRRFEQALQLMKGQQLDEARAAFEALARHFPELSGALTNLGILYAQARQRDAALLSFSEAVEANPRNAIALNWLGVLYRERGDYAQAERTYRRALAASPDHAAALLNLGILYDVYLRRPQDAISAYRSYRAAGGTDLIVEAWIRELEAQSGVMTAARDGGAR